MAQSFKRYLYFNSPMPCSAIKAIGCVSQPEERTRRALPLSSDHPAGPALPELKHHRMNTALWTSPPVGLAAGWTMNRSFDCTAQSWWDRVWTNFAAQDLSSVECSASSCFQDPRTNSRHRRLANRILYANCNSLCGTFEALHGINCFPPPNLPHSSQQ